MKIVVSGGTGFIGEPLVRRLLARGDDVAVLTRNPAKVRALIDAGLEVVERVPIEIKPEAPAVKYLMTKKEKMGHLLQLNGIF